MKKERLESLVKKYASNNITDEEETELMQFILLKGDDLDEIKVLMNHAWEDEYDQLWLDDVASDRIFNQVVKSGKPVGLKLYRLWMGWAAAVLLCCFGAFLFYSRFSGHADKVVPFSVVNAIAQSEHKKIILPDGSSVILNNNSTLEYPENFAGATREVTLKGEGYFDIKHHAEKPFIVHSGKLKTTVLGTAFNIKALNGDKEIVVTVTRGKVSVEDEQKVLGILEPNEQMVFHTDDKKSHLAKVQAKEIIQWQQNDLFFENVMMEQAVATLSKRFNTRITFANDQGKTCRFTATFLKGEKLDEIMKVITSFNDAEYKTSGDEIVITGKNCNN